MFTTIQMKAIEQYFHVVLFIMLYKVVPTFRSVGDTPVLEIKSSFYIHRQTYSR